MRGLFLEDLKPGDEHHSHRRTITESDVSTFVGVTGINDPLFTDEIFASRAQLGSRLVPGPMVVCCALGLTEELVHGTTVAAIALTRAEFRAPVMPGDTIWVATTVGAVRPSESKPGLGIVEFDHVVSSDRSDVVVLLSRRMMSGTREYFAARGLE